MTTTGTAGVARGERPASPAALRRAAADLRARAAADLRALAADADPQMRRRVEAAALRLELAASGARS